MAHGEDHAKQTIILQMSKIKTALNNGRAGDPATHGAALVLLLDMIEPIFASKMVTVDDLESRLVKYRTECPVHAVHAERKKKGLTTVSLGPVKWQGALSNFGIVAVVALFFIGKGRNWW